MNAGQSGNIDIRITDGNPSSTAFVNILSCLFLISDTAVEQCGIEMQRIVCFQPCQLTGDLRIGYRMRFIETVSCKLFNQSEQFFTKKCRMSVSHTSIQEFPLHGLHHLHVLFGNGTSEYICLSQCEPCHDLCTFHDLFLIDHDTVCVFQNRNHLWTWVDNLGRICPAGKIF